MKKITLAFTAVLLLSNASAHGVWVAPHYGDLGIVYGMGFRDDSYADEKVKSVQAYNADLKTAKVELSHKGSYTTIKPEESAAVLTVFLNNGYWKKGKVKKWEAVEQSKIENPADTSTSLKYNIAILKSYTGEMKPFTDLPVQVIPENDPSQLQMGDELVVTVYVDGKPAADVPVTADYVNDAYNRLKTDASGKVKIIVRNNGALNVIAALVNHKTPDDNYAHLQRSVATLSFASKKKK